MVKTLFLWTTGSRRSTICSSRRATSPSAPRRFSAAMEFPAAVLCAEGKDADHAGHEDRRGHGVQRAAALPRGTCRSFSTATCSAEEWYGCSDGTTTGYMKLGRRTCCTGFLPYTGIARQESRGVKMGLRQNRIVVKVGTSTLTNELGQSDLRSLRQSCPACSRTCRTWATR
jgi:hypothetical protein